MTDPYSSAYLTSRPGRPHSTPSPDLGPPGHQVSKPAQKKAGASAGSGKGKGSVRAKSGCYTCRIRRKKCDEQKDGNDNCQTCVRLRLECLGFGQKRPDWMRENNSVPDLREKIKQFLASQGMIKGHSGSGTRNVDNSQAGPILKLSELGQNSLNKQLSMQASGVPQAANTSSGPRSAGSSAASSPQSPRSPPAPSTLYHPPPPQQYSPPHLGHPEPSRYPHVNTSYARDPPRSGEIPYSPISPDLPTPATATSAGPVGHPHGHGHGHGDPYNSPVTSVHRPLLNSQGSHLLRNDVHPETGSRGRFPPHPYTDGSRFDPTLDGEGRRSPEHSRTYYYSAQPYSQHSPVSHSPTLPSQSSSYTSQSQYPGSSLHTSYSNYAPPPSHHYQHQHQHQPHYAQSSPQYVSSQIYSGQHASREQQEHPHRLSTSPTDIQMLPSGFNYAKANNTDTQPVYSPVTSASYTHPQQAQITGIRERSHHPRRTDSQFTDYSAASSDTVIKREQHEPVVKYEQDDTRINSQTPRPSHSRTQVQPQLQVQVQAPYAPPQVQSAIYADTPQSDVQVISPVQQDSNYSQAGSHFPPVQANSITIQHVPNREQIAHIQQFGHFPPLQVSLEQAIRDARTPLTSGLSPIYSANIAAPASEAEERRLTIHDDAAQLSTAGRIGNHKVIEEHYTGYYLSDVLVRQYVFADRDVALRFLSMLSQKSPPTKDAMCLLASLHMRLMWDVSKRHAEQPGNELVGPNLEHFDWSGVNNHFYKRVVDALVISGSSKEKYSEGDAMAGLHMVSSFLFSGGRGPWPIFLKVAIDWVESRLRVLDNVDDLLIKATESEQFIIRTTFWFDVWGSITQMQQPHFINVYRKLFGVQNAFIGERSVENRGPISMWNIIGCSNSSFRAMAEIANLAAWKDECNRRGSLSYLQLVIKGEEISKTWLVMQDEPGTPESGNRTDINFQRRIVSEVFRSSARCYLHMVLSSASPRVSEIKEGVAETIRLLERIPADDLVTTAAIFRTVISAICICGCLTDDMKQVEYFLERLKGLGEEAELFGNCRTVKLLIKRVWELRMNREVATPVDWREVLLEENKEFVLLV